MPHTRNFSCCNAAEIPVIHAVHSETGYANAQVAQQRRLLLAQLSLSNFPSRMRHEARCSTAEIQKVSPKRSSEATLVKRLRAGHSPRLGSLVETR